MAVLKHTLDGVTWTPVQQGAPGAAGPTGPAGPAGAVYPARGKNRIINGDFSVNQRALASVVNSGYVHDRWLLAPYSGTVTYAAVAAALGELPESAPSFARLITAGQTDPAAYTQWVHRVEDVRTLSGKQVTLSFWAKGDVAGLKVGFHFTQNFGAGGSAGVRTAASPVTITTAWARYSMTMNMPSVYGMTIGANSFINCVFWTSAGPSQPIPGIPIQNNTIDIWGVQLEEGPTATPYEHRKYADQLWACKRYFQRWYQPPVRGCLSSDTAYMTRAAMPLPVPMRVAPTLTMGPGVVWAWNSVGASTFSAVSENLSTKDTLEIQAHCVGSLGPAGSAVIIYQEPASTYFDLSAEL